MPCSFRRSAIDCGGCSSSDAAALVGWLEAEETDMIQQRKSATSCMDVAKRGAASARDTRPNNSENQRRYYEFETACHEEMQIFLRDIERQRSCRRSEPLTQCSFTPISWISDSSAESLYCLVEASFAVR
jgi:hypothetical protein